MPTLPCAFVRGTTRSLRVIDGVIALRFDGEEHLLSPGGEAIVPAGFHHTMCAVTGEARIVMGYRRAFRARLTESTSWSQPPTSWSSE